MLANFNFRINYYIECGLKIYFDKINEFHIQIMVNNLLPNFEEEANIKDTNRVITIELNQLSLIFFLTIYCFAVSLFVFILEIIIFYAKNYKRKNNKTKRLINSLDLGIYNKKDKNKKSTQSKKNDQNKESDQNKKSDKNEKNNQDKKSDHNKESDLNEKSDQDKKRIN